MKQQRVLADQASNALDTLRGELRSANEEVVVARADIVRLEQERDAARKALTVAEARHQAQRVAADAVAASVAAAEAKLVAATHSVEAPVPASPARRSALAAQLAATQQQLAHQQDSMRGHVERYREVQAALESALSTRDELITDLAAARRRLAERNDDHESALSTARRDVARAQAATQRAEAAATAAEQRRVAAVAEATAAQAENARLARRVHSMQQLITGLQNDVAQRDQQLTAARVKAADVDAALRSMQEEDGARAEVQSLRDQASLDAAAVRQAAEERAALAGELKQCQAALEAAQVDVLTQSKEAQAAKREAAHWKDMASQAPAAPTPSDNLSGSAVVAVMTGSNGTSAGDRSEASATAAALTSAINTLCAAHGVDVDGDGTLLQQFTALMRASMTQMASLREAQAEADALNGTLVATLDARNARIQALEHNLAEEQAASLAMSSSSGMSGGGPHRRVVHNTTAAAAAAATGSAATGLSPATALGAALDAVAKAKAQYAAERVTSARLQQALDQERMIVQRLRDQLPSTSHK